MGVDRCVCYRVSFKTLLELSKQVGPDYSKLAEMTKCGTQCGMCVPYIHVALATGQARVPVMREEELARAMGGDRAVAG
jgi:bacterioferritin-associated ferredoxin